MNLGIKMLKLWFHGGLLIFALSWVYFLFMITSIFFYTLLETIMFLALGMLLLIPFACGLINHILTKSLWQTRAKTSLVRIWLTGMIFLLIYLLTNYTFINIGLSDIMVLMTNFLLVALVFGAIGKSITVSHSLDYKKEEG